MTTVEDLQLEIRALKEELKNSVPRSRYDACNTDWLNEKEKCTAVCKKADEMIRERDKTIKLWIKATRKREAEAKALREALESIAANTCCDKCQEAALVARAALATGGHWCEWKESEDGIWETACREIWVFTDGGPNENKCRFCAFCGKPLHATKFRGPNDNA